MPYESSVHVETGRREIWTVDGTRPPNTHTRTCPGGSSAQKSFHNIWDYCTYTYPIKNCAFFWRKNGRNSWLTLKKERNLLLVSHVFPTLIMISRPWITFFDVHKTTLVCPWIGIVRDRRPDGAQGTSALGRPTCISDICRAVRPCEIYKTISMPLESE